MKNDFDKKIKTLLEDANLSETGFELNKDAVWNTVQQKQKPKTIPFQKWISHAAAVIVGILLCLPFLLRSNKTAEQVVTITKTISMPAQIIRDTIFIQKTITIPVKENNNGTVKEIHYAHENVDDKAFQPNANALKNPELPKATNTQPVIALSEPPVHKVKVLHLLDMDNENATPRNKPFNDYKLFNKINIASHPNDASESISMIMGIQLSN